MWVLLFSKARRYLTKIIQFKFTTHLDDRKANVPLNKVIMKAKINATEYKERKSGNLLTVSILWGFTGLAAVQKNNGHRR